MYLANHLITHFLVATIEQLRESRTGDIAGISKLGIGNPSLIKE